MNKQETEATITNSTDIEIRDKHTTILEQLQKDVIQMQTGWNQNLIQKYSNEKQKIEQRTTYRGSGHLE